MKKVLALSQLESSSATSNSKGELSPEQKPKSRAHLRLVLPNPPKYNLATEQLELLEESYIGIKTMLRATDSCLLREDEVGNLEVFRSSGVFNDSNRAVEADHPLIQEALSEEGVCVYPTEAFTDYPSQFFSLIAGGAIVSVPYHLGNGLRFVSFYLISSDAAESLELMQAVQSFHRISTRNLLDSTSKRPQTLGQHHFGDRLFEIIEEHINQCFWLYDLDSRRAVLVSNQFESLFDLPRQVIDQGTDGFLQRIYPEDKDRVFAELYLNLGREFSSEFRIVTSSGELRWIWLRAFPIAPAQNSDRNQFLFLADEITEKKQLEEIRKADETDLMSSTTLGAVRELAANICHEINQPLSLITALTSSLKQHNSERGDVTSASLISQIDTTCVHVGAVVRSLHSLSQSRQNDDFRHAQLITVIQTVQNLSQEKFRVGNVQLKITMPSSNLRAEMQVPLMAQVLLNLVNNAYDAVVDEYNPWVEIQTAEDTDSVYFYVIDSGPGIPIYMRQQIFEPFFTTKEKGKGTGLGLALGIDIVKRHGGSLRLDALSAHTKFVVQIPKKKAA